MDFRGAGLARLLFDTGLPASNPMVTSWDSEGAFFGLLVSIQMCSGAALAGSSSSPPSCEICQMLRSRE